MRDQSCAPHLKSSRASRADAAVRHQRGVEVLQPVAAEPFARPLPLEKVLNICLAFSTKCQKSFKVCGPSQFF